MGSEKKVVLRGAQDYRWRARRELNPRPTDFFAVFGLRVRRSSLTELRARGVFSVLRGFVGDLGFSVVFFLVCYIES